MPFAKFVKSGTKAFIVDDLLTTGGSIAKEVGFLESLGVEVIGAAVVISRNPDITAADCKVPSLIKLEEIDPSQIHVMEPEECLLCRTQIPMRRNIAHNDAFLAENPDYPILV
jgi:orotate phosphoribosyltransferase